MSEASAVEVFALVRLNKLLFAMVFGSYILAGGKMAVILHSLPYELMAILGAAVAAFLIGNSVTTIVANEDVLG